MFGISRLVSAKQKSTVSSSLAWMLIASGVVALPFTAQATSPAELVGDVSSVCAATGTSSTLAAWGNSGATSAEPDGGFLTKWATPSDRVAVGLIATKSGSAVNLTDVPDTKDASRYLSYPFTTDVGTRVVVDGIFYGDGIATAVNMKAELFSISNSVSTRVTGAETAEVVSDSSETSYRLDTFATPNTLLASDAAYELRLYIWHASSTINGFDDFGITFKPCLAGAPTLGEITRTSTTASVVFTPPALNGGSTITNYEYSIDSGVTWIPRSPESTASPLSITGITADSAPAVRLRAITAAGSGVAADSGSAPVSSLELLTSVGNFGAGQGIAPIDLKVSGSGTYTYSVTDLPTGLTITTDRMELSGKPTNAGPYNFSLVVQEAGQTIETQQYTGTIFGQMVFDNVALRFGNGNEHSVNARGLFQQPFYRSPVDSEYYKLTFSTYPLDMAVGIGVGNGSHWTGTIVKDLESLTPVVNSQTLDYSNFTVRSSEGTSRARGYGVLTVSTRFNFQSNAQPFEVTHKYTLGQNASFVKIESTVKNLDSTSAPNVHIWVGTRDDYVGSVDQPLKTRGHLDGPGGSFQAVGSRTASATALRITTANEGALFYSTTPGTNMIVDDCCNFSDSYNQNPSVLATIDSDARDLGRGFDGSYAALLPVGDLAQNGGAATITWFYAAGAINDLDTVAQAVAGAASNAPTVTRSGSNVNLSWTAPDAGVGRVVSGYQYRYYSAVDSNNDPIWIESSVLPSSQLSDSISGLSSSIAHNFQVRTITEATAGGQSQTGDWSSTATLAPVPAWNPSSRTLTGPVSAPFSSTIETNNATGLVLTSGATVTVTGLPIGVSFNVLRASTANQFPAVELSGTPTVPGTYTVTITVTDSAGNVVTSDFTFTVTSGGSGSSGILAPIVTPSPRPTPVIARPTPRPSPTIVRPAPTPAPTQAVTVPLGPVALLERRDPSPNTRFDNPTQIPRDLADILARPWGYTAEQSSGTPILPQLNPSDSLAYENGSPVLIQLVRTEEDNGYALIGDGWQVTLEAADSSGAPLTLDGSGNIILNADRFVQFSGTGFAPGSIIKVWLFSDPTEVSEVLADASGNFVGQAQLPEGIPTGEHTVQLNGLTKDGQLRSVSLGVVVQPDLVVAPAPLDLTGLMNGLLIPAAGVLLFFFILWRRRKKKEEEGETPSSSGIEGVPILASEGFEASQQFPNDSRRKIGPAAPPNRKRFGFKPKGA